MVIFYSFVVKKSLSICIEISKFIIFRINFLESNLNDVIYQFGLFLSWLLDLEFEYFLKILLLFTVLVVYFDLVLACGYFA